MPRVSESHFVIAYDGPALDAHQMDVADLARSLLALSAAFKDAQRAIAPDTPPVNLHATATAAGSFEVGLALIQSGGIVDGVLDLLTGRTATAVVNAAGLAAIVWEAVRIVKQLAGRAILKARHHDEGTVTITLEDGDTITLSPKALAVVASVEFRKDIAEAFAPLAVDGIEHLEIRDQHAPDPVVTVSSTERSYFDPPPMPDSVDVATTTREAVLQVVGVEFDWRKWRFTEGNGSDFYAEIADQNFRSRIQNQELTLGAADLLRVTLRTRQYRDRKGVLRSDHVILDVLEHIDGGRQLAFDYEYDDAPDTPQP